MTYALSASAADCSRVSDRKQQNFENLMGWVSHKPKKIQWEHWIASREWLVSDSWVTREKYVVLLGGIDISTRETVSSFREKYAVLLGGIGIHVWVQSRI